MTNWKVRQYYRRMIECSFLEEAADKDRHNRNSNEASKREQCIRIHCVEEDEDGVNVVFVKNLKADQLSEIPENSFVNVRTIRNISFSRCSIYKKLMLYGDDCLKPERPKTIAQILEGKSQNNNNQIDSKQGQQQQF